MYPSQLAWEDFKQTIDDSYCYTNEVRSGKTKDVWVYKVINGTVTRRDYYTLESLNNKNTKWNWTRQYTESGGMLFKKKKK